MYDEVRSVPKYDYTTVRPNEKRDRLTGSVLDDSGRYRVPVVVDGGAYAPRYHPCANSDCLAAGANLDLGDIETLRWVLAADAKAISDTSYLLTVSAIGAPARAATFLSNGSNAASLLPGYMKGEFTEALSNEILSAGFQKYAMARGVPEETAGRITNSLSAMKVLDNIVTNGKQIFADD